MCINVITRLLLLCSLCLIWEGHAEDIELYVQHNSVLEERPRVLIIFDTSASMRLSATTGENCGTICPDSREKVAKEVVSALINDNPDIDFGLMGFYGDEGGYVFSAIGKPAEEVLEKLNSMISIGSTPLTETLWEAYSYITGQSLYYALNVDEQYRDTSIERLSSSNLSYISPFDNPNEFRRCDNSVNIIYMTDGDPTARSDGGRDSIISILHRGQYGRYLNSDDRIAGVYLHKLALIMHGMDGVDVDLFRASTDISETARIYTIGFGSGVTSSGKQLLYQTARQGGGAYFFASTASALSEAFKKTITQIRQDNSTFTAPSVTTNSSDGTRSREAIYYSMFYPSTNARWQGNLKKLKFINNQLVDSGDFPALDENGSISSQARTFWLPEDQPSDGGDVKKGGANLILAKATYRKILTDAGGLVEFTKENVSQYLGGDTNAAAVFGVPTEQLENTINWARGIDVDDEDGDTSVLDVRLDIMGDPLHSKPVTIDYGNGDIRILIGTNAGFLHFFQDKEDVLTESWAFFPSNLYGIIKPLRENETDSKVYGVDGPISVYFDDKNFDGIVNNNDRVWAFFGFRRGGNRYYALDITIPDNPKLLWSNPIIGGIGDYKELAQTWSKPTVTYINLTGYENKPVLIFSAGYDTNKDNLTRTDDSIGRGIYIVDAQTGNKIWALTPDNGFLGKHSIAADVSTLDSDYDGYVDRLYIADTGGDIWRIDMPSKNPTDSMQPWTHFKLASLGGEAPERDRRFFYKPVIASTLYSKVTKTTINGSEVINRQTMPFDGVLIGSGNRAAPTSTQVNDQLFMIRDLHTVTHSFIGDDIPETISQTDLMNMNSDPFGNALTSAEEFTNTEVELSQFQGWYYDLSAIGEKSLAASTVIGGVAYFSSFTPGVGDNIQDPCALAGGVGGIYAFHLHYGTKVYDDLKLKSNTEVPDTPQIFYGVADNCVDEDNSGYCDFNSEVDSRSTQNPDNPSDTIREVQQQSQFYIISGVDGTNMPFIPKKVTGPNPIMKDGKFQLVDENIGFGFETQQTYIYKKEVNDKL